MPKPCLLRPRPVSSLQLLRRFFLLLLYQSGYVILVVEQRDFHPTLLELFQALLPILLQFGCLLLNTFTLRLQLPNLTILHQPLPFVLRMGRANSA